MITPSFSLTATERVLPKLALDFTTASLDPRITFTRTTGASNPATFVNSNGYIALAANNSARFDYDPVTLACRGLLIEEARQNLCLQSQDFSTTWYNGQSSESVDVAVSPDGTQNADKLIEDTNPNSHQIRQDVTTTAVATTFSVFVKAAERSWVALAFTDSSNTIRVTYFDVGTGAIGTVGANTTASIRDAGNGWWRCAITLSAAFAGANNLRIQLATGNNGNSYTGDGTSGIYIWGAQLEAGAFATSYIPTTSAALTRNADVVTITGTNFSDWWQASKGGVLVRARPGTVSGTRPWVQFDDGTADNIIALRGVNTDPQLYIKATTDQATIDAGTIAANTSYRLAGSWKAGNGVATLNGFVPVKGTPASIPAATQARLGSDGTNYLNGHLQSIEYWDEFLTPATLQSVATSAGYRSIIHPVLNDTIITEPV